VAIALITGSAGLIGSEASEFFAGRGLEIVGIDNDMRKVFFGDSASIAWNRERLERQLGAQYRHVSIDIRDADAVGKLYSEYGHAIKLVVHAAAQPSHDWAAREPFTDFGINALGTLNMLEATRLHAPEAVFIFTSTNKVYGDTPNRLPLVELEQRWEIASDHRYTAGIAEDMSVDDSMHSLFGASKLAADVLVQEYGKYFGLNTACFRGGCLTGPNHTGAELHGFLAYLMKCAVAGTPYTVYGYGGKQVRDNIHSADLIRAFDAFFEAPRAGEVYNIGGGRHSNCSILEAIALCEELTGQPMNWTYSPANRAGDHIWWISSTAKFQRHHPEWRLAYDTRTILKEIYEANVDAGHVPAGSWRRSVSRPDSTRATVRLAASVQGASDSAARATAIPGDSGSL
jgi:CDP-paratose 2-epimerase